MIESFITAFLVLFIFIVYIAIRLMMCFYRYISTRYINISTRFTDRVTNEDLITKIKKCVNPINYN